MLEKQRIAAGETRRLGIGIMGIADMLNQLGMATFAIEPRTFEGVSSVLERLASLAGTESEGYAEAARFRQGIAALAKQYRGREPVRVFYQVWDQPLMTINDEHLIGKVISLCGGQNIFGEMARLVPRIDGVMQAKESKYIMLHAPKAYLEQVKSLLPGAENPTVLPLAGADDTVAIHVVSPENLFWETMEKLKALGCSSILVMPIEKMMG